MDPVRQSALIGAVMGVGVAVMGIAIIGMGLGVVHAHLDAPRAIVVAAGAGLVLCGAAFALVTMRLRWALFLATPGAALTFVVPLAWAAMSSGARECTLRFVGGGGASVALSVPLDEATCGRVLVGALVVAVVVVLGMAFAWRRARR